MARMQRRRRAPRKYARLVRSNKLRGRYMNRRLRPAGSSVHRFKEVCIYPGGLNVGANTTSTGIMTFALNDLTNATSFKTLFDLYKITGVKVRINPRFTNADPLASGNGIAGLPVLYVAENRDPYVPAPTSLADVLNDDGVKILRLNRPYTMYLKNPKAEIKDANNVSLPFQFNASSTALQPWLTTGGGTQSIDQSSLLHFGYRWWLDNSLCQAITNIEVFYTLYFSMKEQD